MDAWLDNLPIRQVTGDDDSLASATRRTLLTKVKRNRINDLTLDEYVK
jgi:hypothetical protein